MAEIIAEIILSVIAERVLEKIGPLSLSQISLAWGLKKELKKLENTLSTIKAVLLDAEEQQEKSLAVRDWLENLKDVVYDVDDVLDEFSTEALRQEVQIRGSMLKEVDNFFSRSNPLAFRFKIGHKIKDVRESLDNIAADMNKFHFIVKVVDARVENRVREQTHSFVRESNVIGRNNDKKKIVKLLLSSSNDEGLSVIPIVGLGGIGKTTLAKLVYNDMVVNKFNKIWVCVSVDFDIKKIIEKIIKSATDADCGHLELDQLQTRLRRDVLNAEKFLLVLDDVWNEDRTKWTELRDLLREGSSGSKIIVTTRSMTTASIMGGTTPPYKLRGLPDDECLSILVKCAFEEGHEKGHPNLVEIGKAIVSKCGGIPLAVRTLGCSLYMKTEERDWLYINDSDLWKLKQKENDILPALMLSYHQLPSYLKQCFAYCSIFPKGDTIPRFILITHWMALGFLPLPDGSLQLEDIGHQYYYELKLRSFFEDGDDTFFCKMHDLVHDLAQLVAGTKCLNGDFNSKTISERVRHVSFIEEEFFENGFPTSLLGAKKLRSISFFCVEPNSKSFVDTLILHFRCLRVLEIIRLEFEELPSFVGDLKHLRLINLMGNHSLKVLPNSIGKLLNLQTLYLSDCEKLQDLPRDIGKLINLRHLSLSSQLFCMLEKGLQGLTTLRSLWFHRCSQTSLPEGIQHLTSLRILRISECGSLASLPSGMKHLTSLEQLRISNCEELNLLEGEDMQGLWSLRSLDLIGLPKLVALPQGLQRSAATLQYLSIVNCAGLTTLPEWLQNFTSLQRLQIVQWPNNILSLPCLTALRGLCIMDFQSLTTLSECLQTLASLQELRIVNCPKLLSLPEVMQDFASLQKLYIENCPNLSSLPEGMQHLTALRELFISGCPQLSRRYKEEAGEDWQKISHIPEIYIFSDEDSDAEDLGQ